VRAKADGANLQEALADAISGHDNLPSRECYSRSIWCADSVCHSTIHRQVPRRACVVYGLHISVTY
jgi:hypothetical protein